MEAAAGRPAPLEFRRGDQLLSAEVESAYDEKLDLASRNLPGVAVLPVAAIDPRSLLAHEHVLATVGAVRMLEERLA